MCLCHPSACLCGLHSGSDILFFRMKEEGAERCSIEAINSKNYSVSAMIFRVPAEQEASVALSKRKIKIFSKMNYPFCSRMLQAWAG